MTRFATITTGLTLAAMVGLSIPAALAQQTDTNADAAATASTMKDAYSRTVRAEFADATFAVEQAITNSGLVIDSTHHVGDMLSRTKQDVGGSKDLYAGADIYNFCSAVQSRTAMEADINNIQFCPYGIFVFATADAPDQVTIGHHIYPGESMAGVNAMLDKIVDTAAE